MSTVDEILCTEPPAFARAVKVVIAGNAAAQRTELAALSGLVQGRSIASGSIPRRWSRRLPLYTPEVPGDSAAARCGIVISCDLGFSQSRHEHILHQSCHPEHR